MTFEGEDKKNVIEKHRKHESDTGSPEVQIAILTEEINQLTGHLKQHKKLVLQSLPLASVSLQYESSKINFLITILFILTLHY